MGKINPVNQTAINHYTELNKRIVLCNYLDFMFGTEHPFEKQFTKHEH